MQISKLNRYFDVLASRAKKAYDSYGVLIPILF